MLDLIIIISATMSTKLSTVSILNFHSKFVFTLVLLLEFILAYAQSGFFTSFGELDPFPLCALRFFYCRSGSAPFQIFLVLKDKTVRIINFFSLQN